MQRLATVVRIFDLRTASSGVQLPEKSLVATGRASDLNSLQQNLPVDQEANSTTPYREHREYKQDKSPRRSINRTQQSPMQ